MSSWRDLLLRIGDKSPEYGTSSDFKDHIVRTFFFFFFFFSLCVLCVWIYFVLASSEALTLTDDSLWVFVQETCFGVLRRELEHSEDEILNVSQIFISFFPFLINSCSMAVSICEEDNLLSKIKIYWFFGKWVMLFSWKFHFQWKKKVTLGVAFDLFSFSRF